MGGWARDRESHDAFVRVPPPGLSVGLHLNLTERQVQPPLAHLQVGRERVRRAYVRDAVVQHARRAAEEEHVAAAQDLRLDRDGEENQVQKSRIENIPYIMSGTEPQA